MSYRMVSSQVQISEKDFLGRLTDTEQAYWNSLKSKEKQVIQRLELERKVCENNLTGNYFLKRDEAILENYEKRVAENEQKFLLEQQEADDRISKAQKAKELLIKAQEQIKTSLLARIEEKKESIQKQKDNLVNGNKSRTLIKAELELEEIQKSKEQLRISKGMRKEQEEKKIEKEEIPDWIKEELKRDKETEWFRPQPSQVSVSSSTSSSAISSSSSYTTGTNMNAILGGPPSVPALPPPKIKKPVKTIPKRPVAANIGQVCSYQQPEDD